MTKAAKKQENYPKSYTDRPHVLVVDDDARICELVSRYLIEHGFVVMTAGTAGEAERMLAAFEFDVVVMDVMMPGESGVDFTVRMRGAGEGVPVLLLTAMGEIENRIEGLEAGADDYLVKPFEPRELVLRLNAILKRVRADAAVRGFDIGDWRYEPEDGLLLRGDESVKLTVMDVNLLNALAGAKGEVMSREELAKVCGVDAGERTIDVQVTRLRKKIEVDTKAPRYLQTVRGKGYVLRV
ncbi:MAG: response regulator [Alphaproteobacteria bacterium]